VTKPLKPLTDTQIRNIVVAGAKQVDIADISSPGLFLRVTASAKSWSLRYTDPKSGRRERMTLGRYPDVSLAAARDRARALRADVAAGTNPIEQKRQERAGAEKRTFAHLAERFVTEHSRRRKRTAATDVRNLRLHVLPLWASRDYASITRADIISLAEGLVRAGKGPLANKCQALISSIFTFAIDADLVETNPASRLRKRGVETARSRTLDDPEIRLFWSGMTAPAVPAGVGPALRLTLLTGLRAGEVAGLARDELLDLDEPDKAAILLPGTRVKNRRDHLVPLSAPARAIVLEALAIAGEGSRFVFPSRHKTGVPTDPHELAKAMTAFAASLPDGVSWKTDPPTCHDLRRTLATRLSALGVVREDRLAVLNHTDSDTHSKYYDRYERASEKRRALNLWAAELQRILDGTDRDNVVTLRRSS
jgi:integrase